MQLDQSSRFLAFDSKPLIATGAGRHNAYFGWMGAAFAGKSVIKMFKRGLVWQRWPAISETQKHFTAAVIASALLLAEQANPLPLGLG